MFIPRKPYNKSEKKIIIFSGAGLDAPSGIKTFRDSNGLWNNHDIDVVCNQATWKNNFDLVHQFYNERRVELGKVEANRAHLKIKEIVEEYGPDNVFNITMNVSDFFERLNTPVLHLHGELTKMECEHCNHVWDIGYTEYNGAGCPKCQSKKSVRPHIVFFGGQAPMYTYLRRALEFLDDKNSVIVVIGTQGNVINITEYIRNMKCKKILCNFEESKYIDEEIFDEFYYKSIIDAMDDIIKNIKQYF